LRCCRGYTFAARRRVRAAQRRSGLHRGAAKRASATACRSFRPDQATRGTRSTTSTAAGKYADQLRSSPRATGKWRKGEGAVTSKSGREPAEKYWRVVGFRGQKLIYERFLPRRRLPERRAAELIKCLLCRHLTEDEVVDHSIDPHSRILSPQPTQHAERGKSVGRWGLSVGNNPYYSAVLVDRPRALKGSRPSLNSPP
jgi:hypothetical protein